MKPILTVAHLDGKTTWKMARNKGADAALFVTKIPVEGGGFQGFAFLVNGGKMADAEAQNLLKQSYDQYGTKLFAYVNLDNIDDMVLSHYEGPLGSFMVKALQMALELTGVLPKFRQMLLNSKNPRIQEGLFQALTSGAAWVRVG